jgi:hypothetical protein
MVILPVNPDFGHYEFELDIDDVSYGFALHWNDRAEAWFMTLKDSDGNVIVGSKRLVLDTPLYTKYSDSRLFTDGDILCLDNSNTGQEMAFEDLGNRVGVVFLTFEELLGE